jgi:hypothetical protein
MKKTVVVLSALLLKSSISFAAVMTCKGALQIFNPVVKTVETHFSDQNSFGFTVLDSNQREILKVWPWSTIQTKTLLYPVEQKTRHLQVSTNGMSWFSVTLDSTSEKKRDEIYCEVTDSP